MELSSAEEDNSVSNISNKNGNESDGDIDQDEDRSNGDGDGYDDGGGNINLRDSEFTVDSLINESGSGIRWFGGIGTDFLHCLTENVTPVVSGVATLVHKTAVAVANEISQLERDGELEAAAAAAQRCDEDSNEDKWASDCHTTHPSSTLDSNEKKSENLTLPWEICRESSGNPTFGEDDGEISVYFTDKELMRRIFALSSNDAAFLHPFSDDLSDANEAQTRTLSSFYSRFVMDEARVKLIHRILDIDENLASVHSRLTGGVSKSSETSFWMNYFFHCERVRADEFCRRKKRTEKTESEINPCSEAKVAKSIIDSSTNENIEDKSPKNDTDDESLVPIGSDNDEGLHDDNSSYVIQSAPSTADTFATSRSVDNDIVLVDINERMCGRKSSI